MKNKNLDILQKRFKGMSKLIDECFLKGGGKLKKRHAENMVALLEARSLSGDLLEALMRESLDTLMLRTAWREVVSNNPPMLH